MAKKKAPKKAEETTSDESNAAPVEGQGEAPG